MHGDARGSKVDAVVEVRRDSPTYGGWEAFELNNENRAALLRGGPLSARAQLPPAAGGAGQGPVQSPA